jgi:protein phosphatase
MMEASVNSTEPWSPLKLGEGVTGVARLLLNNVPSEESPKMMNSELVSSDVSAVAKPRASIEAAGATNVGLVRSANEDAYLIATLQRSMVVHDASPEAARGWVAGGSAGTLLMVADGMGGQGGGHVASQIAVNTVAGYLLNVMPWATAPAATAGAQRGPSLPGVRDGLSSALVIGDSTVKNTAVDTATPHMGTTLTMALVLWPVLYVAHVGDTRCYLLRAGKLTRLTTDHTVAQMIVEGGAEPIGPDSDLHHILWNSLGGSEQLAKPEIAKLGLEIGDLLLLCSDGLTKHLSDEELMTLLSANESSANSSAKLIERAIAKGGSDNVTVVIANARAGANRDATQANASKRRRT